MSRSRALAYALAACVTAGSALADAPPGILLGTVSSAARPVGNVLVIALNLTDFAATQTYTARDGSFSLAALRNGIYKLIAVKEGFAPAITTVVRTNKPQRVTLRLEAERTAAARRSASQEIWELRGSLPADILRDIDMVLSANSHELDAPRVRGEVRSLATLEPRTSSRAFAQTSLGLEGRLNENWHLGVKGNLQRFDPADEALLADEPAAASSAMRVELRSSPTDAYKLATTRSSWLYDGAGREADVEAHDFEWQRGAARLNVRYVEQENLFTTVAGSSNLIEVAGDTTILQTPRNDLGLAVRLRQETAASNDVQFRTAELSANGSVVLHQALALQYGISSNVGLEGQEWAPRTGVQWTFGEDTSLVASVMYKAVEREASSYRLPSVAFWSEDGRSLPRYAYSVGFVSGPDEANRVSALFTVTAVDTPLRVVFTNGYDQFWDGLHVDAGDLRRDVRLAYRRQFGDRFAVDIATTAGTATSQAVLAGTQKTYVTGDLQSTFTPTGTTVVVSYREIEQPREGGASSYRTERIHVRMAQSLYLPFDLKLLLGLELARAENSPYLIDAIDAGARKYVGGLSVNF